MEQVGLEVVGVEDELSGGVVEAVDLTEAEPLECMVVEIAEETLLSLYFDCEQPVGVDMMVTIDLAPTAEIDLLAGDVVEVATCGSGVRISDARGLVFGALDKPRDFGNLDMGEIASVLAPLKIDIIDRECRDPRFAPQWDDELTLRDGNHEVAVYSGNSAILEESARWLVVVESMWNGVSGLDMDGSRTDLAVLRIR